MCVLLESQHVGQQQQLLKLWVGSPKGSRFSWGCVLPDKEQNPCNKGPLILRFPICGSPSRVWGLVLQTHQIYPVGPEMKRFKNPDLQCVCVCVCVSINARVHFVFAEVKVHVQGCVFVCACRVHVCEEMGIYEAMGGSRFCVCVCLRASA